MSVRDIDFSTFAEPVARALFGEPNPRLSKPGELRFGENGSLKVSIQGPTAGTFSNFETSESGGLLDLIVAERGGDRKDALAWMADTFKIERDPAPRVGSKSVSAVYPYHDAEGRKQFEVVRLDPKDFRQRRSETEWGVKGCPVLPYRLPEMLEAMANERPILVVEGEKDADRLARLGITATCNAGGAGKWRAEHAEFLKGADVVIVPDNDEPGREHGQGVARSLKGIARRIRVLDLPNLPRKGDVSDWLDGGGRVEALHVLIEASTDWHPTSTLGLTWLGEEDSHPPRKWLAKGLLGQNEMSVLFAPSGGGKSFVALDLGATIAAGGEWFDHRVEKSAVLYIAGEGSTGFRMRMKAWRLAHQADAASFAPFVMLPRSLDLYTKGNNATEIAREAMAEIQERAGIPVRLIILDTLSRMMHGGVDSDPKDMKLFLECVEELRRETGAHVLIVHHTGKEQDKGMRGSSMLRDFADTVLKVESPIEEGPHRIIVEKQKDGEEGRNYRFRLTQSTIGTDEEGDDVTSCVIEPLGASETTGPAKARKNLTDRNEIARRVLADLLDTAPVTSVTSAFPPGVTRTVTVESWRIACRDRFAMDSDDAFRKAWERLKNNLLRLCIVGIAEGRVWLA